MKDYVENLNPKIMTGSWVPIGKWNRIHGDGKSTTGGKFHMETIHDSTGKFKVKLVEDRSTIKTLEYGTQPSFELIVADLRKAYGLPPL